MIVLCFQEVFGGSNCACKKGHRFQLCHQFLAVFFLGQYVVMSQMSLYIELDLHYYIVVCKNCTLSSGMTSGLLGALCLLHFLVCSEMR